MRNKDIYATRIDETPRIDGRLDESFWSKLEVASEFVVYTPGNGLRPTNPTSVMFAYDDHALYVGAVMYDSNPDSICKELGKRDQVESLNTDYISIDILPYNDGLNMYEFKVTPSNLQNDCKYSAIGQDINWDAVWESATRINDSSWVAEIKIPYSALRFPNTSVQEWGINMWRNFHRKHEYSTWTFVNNQDQDIFKYYGKLLGIKDIKPPLRLSLTPYLAGYTEKQDGIGNWKHTIRGGLDIRYGINESYTLDMMLIPDFGQVQSDDVVLNLTPFEIRYDEKRQFFSEATELFNKCGIFYSRRVGNLPRNYIRPYLEAGINEIITENPEESRIINATKISGRNSKGLGVGIFNAMTMPSDAELLDTIQHSVRKVRTQDFTNYNVLVIDQNLKNNSYLTFMNTNYWIPGGKYLANVTGAESRINTASRSVAFTGRLNLSQIYESESSTDVGVRYLLSVSRPKGKFQYEISRDAMDKHYNPNDMGFILHNNEANNSLRLSYFLFDPVWKFQSAHSNISITHTTLNEGNEFVTLRLEADNLLTFRNYWSNYLMVGACPAGYSDFYEARSWGWRYDRPRSYDFNWRIATDARKAFRIHNSFLYSNSPEDNHINWVLETQARMRFSDRLAASFIFSFDKNDNDYGFVGSLILEDNDELVFFGRRDLKTLSQVLNVKYSFNTKMSASLRGRHYWLRAEYKDYYMLDREGELNPAQYPEVAPLSFNVFSADFQFVWYFAPGSELSLVWKNYINTSDDLIHIGFAEDFRNTISAPQANSFSIRILYYIDYLKFRSAISKKG
ncbi:MAG: carbohydrate binding family 9 domain-containing protein [Bacteroidales bacterium]|nr:carbohydrate binding family 9 domain-containing protein [Bacteroidales bacterium]